jgi:cephalosporin-C deacetylase
MLMDLRRQLPLASPWSSPDENGLATCFKAMVMQHSFSFDPTYGFDERALREVAAPPLPEGFEEFWSGTFREAMEVPLRLERRKVGRLNSGDDLFEVEFDGLWGARVGTWMTVPRGEFSRGVVAGHGYGGRDGPDEKIPGPSAAVIFPCARGFNRSRATGVPGAAALHVLHGIESRETYIHRACAADLWSAASALIAICPRAAGNLCYVGGSFGGGIGAMALPWDKRFRRAYLDVPSFGNHPLRVTMPCEGSGQAVRLMWQRKPAIMQVLRYFDSAIAARKIRIPTIVACALFDPSVPPPGQFSVYNAMECEKKLFVRPAAHFDYTDAPRVDVEVSEELAKWFVA